MAGVGFERSGVADVYEQWAASAQRFGHGGGKVLLGVIERLLGTVVDSDGDQPPVVEKDLRRFRVRHTEELGPDIILSRKRLVNTSMHQVDALFVGIADAAQMNATNR